MFDKIKRKYTNFREYLEKGGVVYAKYAEPVSFENFPLQGKSVVITGESTGIGQDIARGIIQMGANVIYIVKRQDDLDMAFKETDNYHFIIWDIADTKIANDMIEKCQNIYGKIDILINCVEFYDGTAIENMTHETYNMIMDFNMKGIYFATKAFIDINSSKPDNEIKRIINVLSADSYKTGSDAYTMSKWQELCFTKGLARELLENNVIVNAVIPFILCEIKGHDKINYYNNSPGFILPEQIVNIVGFLASDFSNGIVGQVIAVGGPV